MHPAIFDEHWGVMMFWYSALTCICGGLLLINVVKSGYNYSRSALNPGIRVSFIEEIQRMTLAMGMIALMPLLITLLIGINDEFVALCAKALDHFVARDVTLVIEKMAPASMFETVISTVIKTFNFLFNKALGLSDIGTLVFNNKLESRIFSSILNPMDTGNIFSDQLLDLSLLVFNIYFNAVYTIREWMLTASVVAAPLMIWVWVLSGERTVLEVYFGEIVQATFMQSSHALSLGIFMSIAGGAGSTGAAIDVGSGLLSGKLVAVGVFFAGLAGSICLAVLVVMGVRMITTTGEKEREEAKEGVIKALIGLLIIGLSTIIAAVLARALSGNWGV